MKALITGASSGMGRDMANYLASFGYDLIVVSRDKKKLDELFNDLNVSVKKIEMDLSITDNCIKLHKMLKNENIETPKIKSRMVMEHTLKKSKEYIEDRKLIEKAKGIVMEKKKISENDAYEYIRKISKTRRLSMRRVAEIILRGKR